MTEDREALREALHVEPGMGGGAETVWDAYTPKGVAVVLASRSARGFGSWRITMLSAAGVPIQWALGWPQ
jgi:hypothetical protein